MKPTLQAHLLERAASFLVMADHVAEPEARLCGEPLLQNVGYALELGLKALLVERGWDDDRCRIEVRHDIAKALGEAAKVGFVPAHPDLAALIATISPYYKRHGLSELVATGGLAMSPDQALAVTRSLLDQVRVSVTK
ncbi:hypothetical protein I8G32_02315 [Rhodopseudomonas palustris]|uniref:HEPN domain-containing protein n=2 Tax=Alphaproteobacteria TaxID=28211 RepID=A0AAF0BQ54_RHOPA|nr:hypothetical protein [Rhodopseudomonas palustris]OPF90474.1 hypothetical protein B1S06_24220 [Rhodopseudomonas palustris]QQM03772.1 hypothetical protein I8G32_02315 [Rhodopseudomonas palustris]RJF61845.1 hypothetical protein D4Q71_19005 [Rhodopseudomonas palustris]WAB79911.1 hypothetical protein OR798_11650 [Rhodopseudomonas palustris]WCL92414.1 hypothetical protein TX73_011645 [Rhodopseudomonas palustris CGA009]